MPVHLRLNDPDTARNPYINFVTALPGPRHDEALLRLQQLAAMVKPLMKDQAFHINSLEEYEYNREFSGRCWENGEVIELVLTTADGSWQPLQFVLYVFCHELAHIKHMNHIPHLHGALTRHLKLLADAKQKEGYYGDGLWSSGRQLQDGSQIEGLGMNVAQQGLPEQVCGGAFRRARASQRRRGKGPSRSRGKGTGAGRKFKGPSLHTGTQTTANTRGGNRRVKLEAAASSSGNRVDGRDWFPPASAKNKEYKLDENSTFRRRTQSKDAREKRAAAALARFGALQSAQPTLKSEGTNSIVKEEVKVHEEEDEEQDESVTEAESDDEKEEVNEDDAWLVGNDLPEQRSASIKEERDEQPIMQASASETAEQRTRRMRRFDNRHGAQSATDNTWRSLLEVDGAELNKKRVAGQDDDTTVLQYKSAKVKWEDSDDDIVLLPTPPKRGKTVEPGAHPSSKDASLPVEWICRLCTLRNAALAQRCAACETTRGKTVLGA